MIDKTFADVDRLWKQGYKIKPIALKLNIGFQKVRQILLTMGRIETRESRLFAAGKSIEEIMEITGRSRKGVTTRLPYTKGMYFAEHPTDNAIRIRKCKAKKKAQAKLKEANGEMCTK